MNETRVDQKELQREYLASRVEIFREEYSNIIELGHELFTADRNIDITEEGDLLRLRSLMMVDSLRELSDSMQGLVVAVTYSDQRIRREMEEADITITEMSKAILTKIMLEDFQDF